MFQLSKFEWTKQKIVRDGFFECVLFPECDTPNALCYVEHTRFLKVVNKNLNITAVITTNALASKLSESKGLIVCDNPAKCYYDIHNYLAKTAIPLVQTSFVDPTATIAETAIIKPNVIIQSGVKIADYAVVYENTIIGKNTYVGTSAIIGNRGMQNVRVEGENYSVAFLGGVKIGSNCEILARAMVQKPYHAFFTSIANNVKISVNSSVGHGSSIGKNTLIAGSTTIAGNVKIGSDVWVGPGTIIRDRLKIGDRAKIIMGSVVTQNVKANKSISGNFAFDHAKNVQHFSRLKRM